MSILDRLDQHQHWCMSGGALGSDLAWGTAAGSKGHGVIHFSFKGHRTQADEADIYRLSPGRLAEADPYCRRASFRVERYWPPKSHLVKNLLRRNWYQVRDATSCYAISELRDGQVMGGTAWAVAMFIDFHDGEKCNAYVFDQIYCHWYQWDGTTWEPIYSPPQPEGMWAGVGSRKLNFSGELAINVLLDYQPKRKTIWDTSNKA